MTERKPRKTDPTVGDHWGLDPHDVRYHERRIRQAKAVGPLGKFFRVCAVGALLAGAAWIYWNFDTVRSLRFDFSRLTSAFSRDTAPSATDGASGEPGTEVVEGNRVAGVSMPTSLDGEAPAAAPAAEPAANARPVDAAAAVQAELARAAPPTSAEAQPTRETTAAVSRPAEEPRPAPPPEPEVPAGPETFGFGVSVMHVSEAEASAAVLVLRDGGRRQASTITWWTTDGTANAGSDFARLDRRTERFGAGEQNRTLYVPIVGDRQVEGPENFYVRIAVGDSIEALAQIEVIIDDDD